jgi:protein gp37
LAQAIELLVSSNDLRNALQSSAPEQPRNPKHNYEPHTLRLFDFIKDQNMTTNTLPNTSNITPHIPTGNHSLDHQVTTNGPLGDYLAGALSLADFIRQIESLNYRGKLNMGKDGKGNHISWCTATCNFHSGCDHVTAGCHNCWSHILNLSSEANWGHPRFNHPFHDRLLHPERLVVLKWQQPEVIFTPSDADLFDGIVPQKYIDLVFDYMIRYDHHVYITTTKRPKLMADYLRARFTDRGEPIPEHFIFGVSISENKDAAFADTLRAIPCTTRFISFEPLIGPVDQVDLTDIQWIVTGGESKQFRNLLPEQQVEAQRLFPVAVRAMDPTWAQEVLDRGSAHVIAAHHKQNGEFRTISGKLVQVGLYRAGRRLNGKFYDGFPQVIASRPALHTRLLGKLEHR